MLFFAMSCLTVCRPELFPLTQDALKCLLEVATSLVGNLAPPQVVLLLEKTMTTA